jgi:uncharacterized membrane protein YbhN (UPF0104 family)
VSTTEHSSPRSHLTRLGSYLGLGIGVAGIAFLTRLVVRDWGEITDAVAASRPGPLVASLAFGLCGMGTIGVTWVWLVRRTGSRLPVVRGLRWYFVGQLGKYIPGGIWPVVGRAELAVRGGVGRRAAYTTTATSMLFTYLAAGVVAAALAPAALGVSLPVAIAGGAAVLGAVALALHPRVTGRLLDVGERVLRRPVLPSAPSWQTTLVTLVRHLPAWAAIVAATWAVSRALSVSLDPLLVAAATPLAWLVGFMIIGLPSGVGVREAVFVAVVATESSDAQALSVALLARMVFIGVDALGALTASLATFALAPGPQALHSQAARTEAPANAASLGPDPRT